MASFCTGCGGELEAGAKFCTGCGQAVGAVPSAAPAAAHVAPPMPVDEPVAVPGKGPRGGGRRLYVWLGALVLLIGVAFALAFVAFERFKRSGEQAADSSKPERTTSIETPAPGPEPPRETALAEGVAFPPAPQPERRAPREPAPAAVSPAPALPAKRDLTADRPPQPKVSPPAPAEPEPDEVAPVETATVEPPAKTVVESVPAPPTQPREPPPAPKGAKVMLSGAEAYSPPPAPLESAPSSPAVLAPKERKAASSGDIYWSGTLDKDEEVVVDFSAGPTGMGGAPLPGKPVKLEVFSPVVEIVEPPSAANGWKRFSFKPTRKAKRSVTINFRWTLAN